MTNLEFMFASLPLDQAARDFYSRCNDYDNDGNFRANDLTDIKRYYAGLADMAAHMLAAAPAGRRL